MNAAQKENITERSVGFFNQLDHWYCLQELRLEKIIIAPPFRMVYFLITLLPRLFLYLEFYSAQIVRLWDINLIQLLGWMVHLEPEYLLILKGNFLVSKKFTTSISRQIKILPWILFVWLPYGKSGYPVPEYLIHPEDRYCTSLMHELRACRCSTLFMEHFLSTLTCAYHAEIFSIGRPE